jgi:hypothetical protein
LNSDFDEDEPYNREDSKEFTIKAFQFLNESYDSVMTSGGNHYVWTYADHILDLPLDSSRYNKSSNSVPFLGTVLHGYTQFAGTPLNMEGDIGYAVLKAVENGASIYFTLSYQNTAKLKEDMELSNYFSIRYDIWKDDVVYYYNYVNSLLKDVQTKLIIDHEFLIGERIPDVDELEADLKAELDALNEKLSNADAVAREERRKAVYEARKTINGDAENALSYIAEVKTYADSVLAFGKELDTCLNNIKKAADDAAKAEAVKAAEAKMVEFLNAAVSKKAYENMYDASAKLVEDAATLIINDKDVSAEVKAAAEATLKSVADAKKAIQATINQADITYTAALRKCDASAVAYSIPADLVIPEETEDDSIVTDDEEETTETETETEENIKNIEEVEEYNYTKYTDDTGSIVAVTYGGKNGNDMEAYKTFILNYNSFSVEVVFEGTTYTIPAFSLVVIYR